MSAITRMIEVAEHNGAYEGDTLIVLDGLVNNPNYGVRLEVEPTTGSPGWTARCRDGTGKGIHVWVPNTESREQACEDALNGYLKIVNYGI